ncbi:LacI family DNA-binding transcriptional regulator [Halobacillus salinus]|uniref:LacI family DNA-binding transcriptional regulator n=1 Tax=Halobacillus salinus TaxID=192814 RepID=UPI0009A724B1|nr:LacI family DNA-binding transcriptional regulator [Halobacillus salinus]
MSVTIKDVARVANVAPSTVSRVLSDSPSISEKTKRRVRQVMDELGYHINYNGRSLVSQSTQTIGIVTKVASIHSFDNPFFSELLRGISEACHDGDYSIYLTTGNTEEAIFRETVKMVNGKRVDGVIVLYSREDDNVVPFLRESNFPFVMVGKPIDKSGETMFVDNDNIQASRDVTNYLLDKGHENVAFIGGDSHFEVARDRLAGFKLALADRGLGSDDRYVKNIQKDEADAEQVVRELTTLHEPPTGIVVTDDYNSMMVMREFEKIGYNLPEDMSIVGFNNTMISRLCNPPLTTVDTQSFQLGHESARNMIDMIKHPDTLKKSIIIPTVIVERDSCMTRKMTKPE